MSYGNKIVSKLFHNSLVASCQQSCTNVVLSNKNKFCNNTCHFYVKFFVQNTFSQNNFYARTISKLICVPLLTKYIPTNRWLRITSEHF